MDLHPEVGQQRRGTLLELTPVDHSSPPGRCGTEENILGDRQMRDEIQLLVDDADAARQRVARALDVSKRAVHANLAGVLAVRAAQDLDKRGLAGAVLAEQYV